MQPPSIAVLITGGTIDKDYQVTTGELIFPPTHIPQLLKQAFCTLPLEISVILQKDSLEMTSTDRETIVSACIETNASQIVITHGTDTMTLTAEQLNNTPALAGKTIILTGAMRPFQLGSSDASFNMGAALMASQMAETGVYIAMNGQLFKAGQCQKNRQQGVFTQA